jgi:SAM-dependent methyltransferase
MSESETQVTAAHYDWTIYNKKSRFASYWHQITDVLATGARSCLEIGTGSGVVKDALTRAGVEVTAVDIAEDLGPDLIGDVRDLPCEEGSFDVVLASQVLEHIPWADVPKAVAELHRVSRSHAVVSLPQAGFGVGFGWSLHLLKLFNDRGIAVNVGTPWRHKFDGQHYWEVGARGTGRKAVRHVLSQGFELEREYVVPELVYHRFYVLRRV